MWNGGQSLKLLAGSSDFIQIDRQTRRFVTFYVSALEILLLTYLLTYTDSDIQTLINSHTDSSNNTILIQISAHVTSANSLSTFCLQLNTHLFSATPHSVILFMHAVLVMC